MKRYNNMYSKMITLENLELADSRARKGKRNQYGVKVFDRNRNANLLALQEILRNKTYRTSPYKVFKIKEPKEREIFSLPYFPDRIIHHAAMIILDAIFIPTFTADTYSCIKGRGIHSCSAAIKKALLDRENTKYCLKLDIKKFYPNIDHDKLKNIIKRKIKDRDMLWLLNEIIDSAPGIPIGNYLSQTFANLYLTPFDHWIKEKVGVKNYFRYADDIVLFSSNKEYLHRILALIRKYFQEELKLEIKHNYQIFPVPVRGADIVGYRHFPTYTKLRDRTKRRFARMLIDRPAIQSVNSYLGLAKHCDSRHLIKKLLHGNKTIQELKDNPERKKFRRRKNTHRRYFRPHNNCARLQDQEK